MVIIVHFMLFICTSLTASFRVSLGIGVVSGNESDLSQDGM